MKGGGGLWRGRARGVDSKSVGVEWREEDIRRCRERCREMQREESKREREKERKRETKRGSDEEIQSLLTMPWCSLIFCPFS